MSSPRARRTTLLSALVPTLLVLSAGCDPDVSRDPPEPTPSPTASPSPTPPPHRCGPTKGTVKYVYDGDTIELQGGQRVRYLLVDTPETTNGKNDCYGYEATEYNRQLVNGQEVTLQYDQTCLDQYGRLLAYVSVGDVEVNTKLIEGGYACVLHIAPNGDDRLAEFTEIQAQAKADKLGMWGKCSKFPCR